MVAATRFYHPECSVRSRHLRGSHSLTSGMPDYLLTRVTLKRRLQVNALARLDSAVTLDMSRPGLAHCSTMRTLRYRPALLVNVLEWSVFRTSSVSVVCVRRRMPAAYSCAAVDFLTNTNLSVGSCSHDDRERRPRKRISHRR